MIMYLSKLKTYINQNFYGLLLILIGCLIQCLLFASTESTWLSLISGISGIISVVLCAQRKMSYYWFGYIQLITYVILCVNQSFYGEIVENAFYAITMALGIYLWKTNYDKDEVIVKIKKLTFFEHLFVGIITLIGIFVLYLILNQTNDTQPFLDSVSTVPAFIAQILLIYRFRENWIYWLIIDLASIIMWANVGNWIMVSQFIFWSINCLYGLYKWH